MKKMRKKCGWAAVPGAFAAAVIVCVALLMFTSLIPQSAIRESAAKSAEYFSEHELFPYLVEGQFNTRQDNYADCILFNIIYHIGTDEQDSRFASLIKSSYYCREMQNVNDGFAEALAGGVDGSSASAPEEASGGSCVVEGAISGAIPEEARVDYFRYWHGSMVFLRPLMVFFDVVGIRLVLGIGAILLSVIASVILWKKKRKSLAACYLLGMICVNCWVIACCIEYVTTFLVMGACCLWVVSTWKEEYGSRSAEIAKTGSDGAESAASAKRWRSVLCLMAVSGVVTCFVDFLTTETLTVTMPLVLELALRMGDEKKLKDVKSALLRVLQCGIVWGVSYAAMFLMKWILAALVLGIGAMKEAMTSAAERLGGTVYLGASNLDPEADLFQRIFGALFRNEGMLFPFQEQFSALFAALAFGFVLMVLFSAVYLFYDKSLDMKTISLFVLLAAVPYARYMALSNHAFIHYFFTYRAQLATIVVLLYLVWEYGLSGAAARFRGKNTVKKRK